MPVLSNFSLLDLNTLRLPARAAQYLRIEQTAQLLALPPHQQRFIFGGGSNLVLLGDVDGLVLHVALMGRRLVTEDAEAWYVEASAGENWHDFVLWTLAQGWPGLENLVLIPGTVGATPVQNIGAYGLEAGERIHQVRAIDLDSGTERVFNQADCQFVYRNSIWKREGWHLTGKSLITSVVFRLPKAWQANCGYADVAIELAERQIQSPTAQQIAEVIIALRQRKLPDPALLPNAGSFFENPIVDADFAQKLALTHPDLPRYPQADGRVKLAAGWLIEQAGWKGRQLGPVGMYEKQALVLVNRGGACAQDLLALMAAVREDVARGFGLTLEPEPVFVGTPSPAKATPFANRMGTRPRQNS
ncbi:MAG: UDP-N-acetylenolpyruvoylglucosamine reductase [Betaproteobacteria bacterium ADurb.Bin341]|nr:MAG: UDP-N-acetylenolpyruvoylglucosamine reductase [Betaproteobacteria bacterium ADurb.Bin341]